MWCWQGRARYIGATWLDPAARAESHLHGDTDHPGSLALREAVATDSEPPTILAAPVPADGDRSAYKQALIQSCSSAGLLAPDYLGSVDPGHMDPASMTAG